MSENAENYTNSLETFGKGFSLRRLSIRKTGREPPYLLNNELLPVFGIISKLWGEKAYSKL